VQAVIAASESAEAAGLVLMKELGFDSVQARAVLDLQYRRLAGRERAQLAEEYQALIEQQSECESIVNSPERQRELVGTEEGAEILRRGSF
jgi:DNA gyrase subunit A